MDVEGDVCSLPTLKGWLGRAMVLDKFQCGGPSNLDNTSSRARAHCACSIVGGDRLDIFFSPISSFFLLLGDEYTELFLKEPLSPKQPINKIQQLI